MITAVIVDDELKGAQSLEILLKKADAGIAVRGIATNALDGIKLVKENDPEILFLDVQMPGHSGFEVLEHIDRDHVFVIFTTAHQEYAIQALRKKAFDYLLKPIDPEELAESIARVRKALQNETTSEPIIVSSKQKRGTGVYKLSIPVKEGVLFLNQDDIVRIEGSGSYSYIYMDNKEKHLVSKSLKELSDNLNEELFFRCHNSHIIHIGKVKKFIRTDGNFVQMEDGSMAEVSRTRKDEFMSLVG
ncbi:MAG TPA: LytTR family DNA-binding domain-containing protein [Flavobacteriales bacterium]|nr:LytTR family DNA-binding domain-containing protein [Flavobacteriales bacterium]